MSSSSKQSIDFYESEAERYDEIRWNSKGGIHNHNIQKKIVLNFVDNWEGKRVLDIATGTGRFALEFAKRGAIVSVVDSSDSMLAITKRKFEEEGLKDKLSIHHGLASKLNFEKNEFDVCVCINALNHIPEYEDVLKEIYRVLKPDGISITNYTNWFSYYLPFGIMINLKKKSIVRDVYTKWFSVKEIFNLNNRYQLKVQKIHGAVHIPGKVNNNILISMLKFLDKISRSGPLKYVSTQIFVKSIKTL